MATSEIIFEVTHALEGGYDARALGHSVFTQGDDRDDLKAMARDAVACHFNGEDTPSVIRLNLVTNQVRILGKSKPGTAPPRTNRHRPLPRPRHQPHRPLHPRQEIADCAAG